MKIQTTAFYMGRQNLHSSKSGKDFTKFSLVVDGQFANFITPKKRGDEIVANGGKVFTEFDKSHAPVKCEAVITLDFTERGNFTGLESIH